MSTRQDFIDYLNKSCTDLLWDRCVGSLEMALVWRGGFLFFRNSIEELEAMLWEALEWEEVQYFAIVTEYLGTLCLAIDRNYPKIPVPTTWHRLYIKGLNLYEPAEHFEDWDLYRMLQIACPQERRRSVPNRGTIPAGPMEDHLEQMERYDLINEDATTEIGGTEL